MSVHKIQSLVTQTIATQPSTEALNKYREQAPFDEIVRFVNSAKDCKTSECDIDVSFLNSLSRNNKNIPLFVNDEVFESDARFYEEVIYQDKKVPTRNNWHDIFNALIWMKFPTTKQYLNQCHIEQIQQHGLHPRTRVRDRITHFDECGLVLFTNIAELEEEIRNHDWHKVFVERKRDWHNKITPVVFGHALYESLLHPFIGLTAKVVVVYLDSEVKLQRQEGGLSLFLHTNNSTGDRAHVQSQASVDRLLLQQLKQSQKLNSHRPWLPLPLLGIPNWAPFSQDEAFYANKNYFMPKRRR